MRKVTISDFPVFLSEIMRIYGNGVPTGTHTYGNIRDMAYLCAISAQDPNLGAIGICPLKDGRWLVTLGGTELMNKSEALGAGEDILSALGMPNTYRSAAIRVIRENIPSGSHVIMAGYSLGSMVMQQALADGQIQRAYAIDAAIGIGCPIVEPHKRQAIVRINDKFDSVRNASLWSALHIGTGKDKEILRDGGYKTTIGAHALSYVASPVWDAVDILGIVNGNNTILVDFSRFAHFMAAAE